MQGGIEREIMGNIKFKKYETVIASILYIAILWNEYSIFTFTRDRLLNIILCNLIVYFVVYKVISVMMNIKDKKYLEIISYIKYAFPMIIIFAIELFLFNLNGNEFLVGDIKFIYDNAIEFKSVAYQFNYFTGYIYIVSYILFRTKLAPLILKFLLQSYLTGYIVYRGKKLTNSKFIYFIYLFIYLLPETLMAHRLHFYVILYIFLMSKCIFDYYEEKKYSIKESILVLIGFSILAIWRVEGVYFIVLAPLIICCINKKIKIRNYAQVLVGTIILTVIVSVPQKIELDGTNEYYNSRLSHWYNYVVVNMFRLGLDTETYMEEVEAIDKVISIDAINKINEELGDMNYEDEYIAWKEGYIGINQYTMDEYNEYSRAVITIIIKEPLLFLKSQWGAWEYTNKLSINWSVNKTNLMYLVTSVISSLYNSRCNLYIPLIITVLIIVCSILKHRWLDCLFAVGIICNWGIVFLLCPAAYIKYHIVVWAGGYMLLIIQLLINNNSGKCKLKG